MPPAPKSQQARHSGAENLRAPGPVGTVTPKDLGASSSEELSSLPLGGFDAHLEHDTDPKADVTRETRIGIRG